MLAFIKLQHEDSGHCVEQMEMIVVSMIICIIVLKQPFQYLSIRTERLFLEGKQIEDHGKSLFKKNVY